MEPIHIRSIGFFGLNRIQSIFCYGNIYFDNMRRGLNFFYITNTNVIQTGFDTSGHNLIERVIDEIREKRKDDSINYIACLVNDDCTHGINIDKLYDDLKQLGIKLMHKVGHRSAYYFLYDNKNNIVVMENSGGMIVEGIYCPNSTEEVVVCCKEAIYIFMIEYIEAFIGKLGCNVKYSTKDSVPVYPEATHLFFSGLPPLFNSMPKKFYVNMEQVTRKKIQNDCTDALYKGVKIIDYSLGNANFLKNMNVSYLPYQYNSNEVKKLKNLRKNIVYDVAFCGGSSHKRGKILDELKRKNIKIKELTSTYGRDRDVEIGKCKLLLNIHFAGDYRIYEAVRCDRWIFSQMMVISEESNDSPSIDINSLVIFEPYDKLVGRVLDVLKNYKQYQTEFMEKYEKYMPDIINNRRKSMEVLELGKS